MTSCDQGFDLTLVSLLRRLQASLGRSSRALVALDLAGIEGETREQRELVRALAVRAKPLHWKNEPEIENDSAQATERRLQMARELRQSEAQVRQALRLQAALLRRSQHKLRVMANMLADPAANYGAPFVPGMQTLVCAAKRSSLGE
jgi:hypothetical protein